MIKAPSRIVNRRAQSVVRRARNEPPPQAPRPVTQCGCYDLAAESGRESLIGLFQQDHVHSIHLSREAEEVLFTQDGRCLYYIEWRRDRPDPSPLPAGFVHAVPRFRRRFGIALLDITIEGESAKLNAVLGDTGNEVFYRGRKILEDGRCMVLVMWRNDEPYSDGTIPPPGHA